ncbi:MAG: hypothetical protein ABIP13_11250 [Tepidiformaceae bacterium]
MRAVPNLNQQSFDFRARMKPQHGRHVDRAPSTNIAEARKPKPGFRWHIFAFGVAAAAFAAGLCAALAPLVV